jgi:hypothetical protein
MEKLFDGKENRSSSIHTGRPTAERLSSGDKHRVQDGLHLVTGGATATDGLFLI